MTNINIRNFTVDHVSKSSGVFSGYNIQIGFSSVIKKNDGSGSFVGDYNNVTNNKHTVLKKDGNQKDE